jgi:archaemetzincin
MLRGTAITCVLVAVGIARADEPDVPPPKKLTTPADYVVCLQPLGKHDAELVAPIARGIEKVYGFTVKTLAARPLPRAAYYKPRKRYRAEKLLDHMLAEVVPGSSCDAVMGFTSVDISTTKDKIPDWGILGLAYLDGKVGVVSSYRTKRRASARKILERTVKVANHELGHVLGLPHMATGPECIMTDAGGTVKTVDKEKGTLCPEERAPIEQKLGVKLPPQTDLDWSWIATGR